MTLPTPVKSWQFLVNQYKSSTNDWREDYRYMAYAFACMLQGIKPVIGAEGVGGYFNTVDANNGMSTPGGGVWTTNWVCVGSSDTVTYDPVVGDTVRTFKWTDTTKVHWGWYNTNSGRYGGSSMNGGQTASWVVLRNYALKLDLLYSPSCSNSRYPDPDYVYRMGLLFVVYWGENTDYKFTGGDLTHRPTSTQETDVGTNTIYPTTMYWRGQDSSWPCNNWTNANIGFAHHYEESTDGTSCRFIFSYNNWTSQVLLFEQQVNAPTEIAAYPTVTGVLLNDQEAQRTYSMVDYNRTYDYYDWLMLRYNNAFYNCGTTGEQSRDVGIIASVSIPHDLDSYGYQFAPIGIYGASPGIRGRLGNLQDIYWGPQGRTEGTTYPADGSRKWIQLGALVLPWTGLNSAPGLMPYLNA